MKTKELKKEVQYNTTEKKYTKSAMYEFDFNTDILVVQNHDNGTTDQLLLQYELEEGENAYFSEEYLPVGMKKDGVKKPDITAMIESTAKKKLKWFIYDMKATVINAEVAMKLCAQWHQGIEHITQEYLNTKSEYEMMESVGVVTRYWSEEKLQEEINECREKLNSQNGLLTGRKVLQNANKYRERMKAAKCIIDKVYCDDDELTGKRKDYEIHYVILNKVPPSSFIAKMKIAL